MKGRLKLLFLPLVRGSNLLKEKKISFRIHFQSRIRLLQYGQKDRLKFLSSITNIQIANRTACNRYGYRKALRSLESLSSRTVAVAVGKEHERLRLPYLSFFPIAHADEDQDQPGPSEANTRDEALSAEQEIEDPLVGKAYPKSLRGLCSNIRARLRFLLLITFIKKLIHLWE